jgi:anti-sigma-K factor RskA
VLAAIGAEGADAPASTPPAARREPPAAARPARGAVVEMPRRSPWAVWAPVAAAAALAVTSAVSWIQSARLGAELAATRARLEALERSAAADSAWNTVLGSPFARHAVLEPTTAGDPRLRARASYDPGTQRAVVVFENLAAPADRDFELWVIRDGAPVSLGVVQPDDRGRATVRLENVGISPTLSAFAVSLEPKGGSPRRDAPTGPVVMLGPLSG